jgi:hypothetical protein
LQNSKNTSGQQLTAEMINAELSKMNTALSTRIPPAEIKIKAMIFLDDFKKHCPGMGFADLVECMSRHRADSQYFPTPHNIIAQYRIIAGERRRASHVPELDIPPITDADKGAMRRMTENFKQKLRRAKS